MNRFDLIDTLAVSHDLDDEKLLFLLTDHCSWTSEEEAYLYEKARRIATTYYGKNIYLRGLIEFTNFCKNDCYYCGIRRSNQKLTRYRLTEDEILRCCEMGYALGYRTFVLQGGEDPYYTDDTLTHLIRSIKKHYPDCALTLSIGEKDISSYQAYYQAGADRYLLREETADETHYRLLHPKDQTLIHRKECLRTLKSIGYQVGCGFMVGSPGQTPKCVLSDLRFMQKLLPDMIGIGPFIPHHDTCFAASPAGTFSATLHILSILRLLFPKALLPATTALASIHPQGRDAGILAGANVIMPNISPDKARANYQLYDGKICIHEEAQKCAQCLKSSIERIGYHVCISRGDPVC